jgi:iron complex outermembrane receptor protein
VSDRLSLYAGYTQGLEDSGVAPNNAQNRGTILPAALTWQVDAGFRYRLASNVRVIAGLFDINKPYFNLDTSNVDRNLGGQHARGLEISISGEPIENLHLNAGALIDRLEVVGRNLSAAGIGSTPVGIPRGFVEFSADYSFRRWPATGLDASVRHWGPNAATVNDAVVLPSTTMVNVGARYKFTLLQAAATLRVMANGITSTPYWYVYSTTPGYYMYYGRSLFSYLTVDL